ncbi:MAG: TraR/DksA C4-type zinc finger protein [Clostridia bacterium]|nr:TraR/DksA C4-type zinc finger protein [Clostridia bacterium]
MKNVESINELWQKAVEFHGHACPGLAYGVRAGALALEKLAYGRAADEELIAIVETDSCSIDGIQVVTGCTLGKGNLIFKDHGKSAFTFALRNNGKAVRIVMDAGNACRPDDYLREKVMTGRASPEEKQLFQEMKEKRIRHILEAPEDEVCTVQWVDVKLPEKAQIFKSIPCELCGEFFMEPRGRIKDGKIVCLSCFREYTRGW